MRYYLAHESAYLEMGIKTYTHILVNMDLREGLIEGMDIRIVVECIQILDYENYLLGVVGAMGMGTSLKTMSFPFLRRTIHLEARKY